MTDSNRLTKPDPPPEPPHPERVGSYASFEGASLAVQHLVEVGHDADDIAVVAAHLHPVRRHQIPVRVARTGLRVAAVVIFAGLVTTALLATTASSGGRTVLLWLVAAFAIAALASLVPGWASLRWETDRTAVAPLQPDRFEVTCGSDVDHARAVLARWWDPHARPADASTAGRR